MLGACGSGVHPEGVAVAELIAREPVLIVRLAPEVRAVLYEASRALCCSIEESRKTLEMTE
jgi:hypothetical protein